MARRQEKLKRTSGKSIFFKKGTNGNLIYQKQPFESSRYGSMEEIKVKTEPKATIYQTMLETEAYQSLSAHAMLLHKVCLLQMFQKKKPFVGGYHVAEDEFCVSYGYLRKEYPVMFPNDSKIRRAKKELLDKGFIVEVSNGKKQGMRSIFKMSDKWKYYKPEKKQFKGLS